MTTIISELFPTIRRAVEPDRTDGARAAELVEEWAEAERLCAAAKALYAHRAAATGTWRREGYRSAAHWLAVKSISAVGMRRALVLAALLTALTALPARGAGRITGFDFDAPGVLWGVGFGVGGPASVFTINRATGAATPTVALEDDPNPPRALAIPKTCPGITATPTFTG